MRAVVPILFFVLAFFGLSAAGKKQGQFGSILFTSGMVMIPLICLGAFATLITFLKIESPGAGKALMHVGVIVLAFTLSALILMIKASLVSILGFSRKAAFWLVPTVLIVVGYLTMWTSGLLGKIFE